MKSKVIVFLFIIVLLFIIIFLFQIETEAAVTESLFVNNFKVLFDVTSTDGEYSGAVYFKTAII